MKKFVGHSAIILALLLAARPAWAPFHLVVIEELFFGTAAAPEAQYLQLLTLASGQIFVNGQRMSTQDASGESAGLFGAFTQNFTANPGARVHMLAGTQAAADLFCLPMDQVVTGRLVFPDGRVCFGLFTTGSVDCVAYGDYVGDTGTFGDPAVAPELGVALARTDPTVHENNADDFALADPMPTNNLAGVGRIDGVPGDADGSGTVDSTDVRNEVAAIFAATRRCDLDADLRGSDANVDTRVNAADVIETIQLALAVG